MYVSIYIMNGSSNPYTLFIFLFFMYIFSYFLSYFLKNHFSLIALFTHYIFHFLFTHSFIHLEVNLAIKLIFSLEHMSYYTTPTSFKRWGRKAYIMNGLYSKSLYQLTVPFNQLVQWYSGTVNWYSDFE